MSNKSSIQGVNNWSRFSAEIAGALLIVFIICSFWLILIYVDKERSRDLMSWQSRLALLAEIRVSSIENWLSKRKNRLQALANNDSLRLYLTQKQSKEKIDRSVLGAQKGYVRNLLLASAHRFDSEVNVADRNNSNVNISNEYGMAILGVEQQLIMATRGFPNRIKDHKKVIANVFKNSQAEIIDLHLVKKDQVVFGFIVPVLHIQNEKAKSPVGAVMVLLNPQETLYSLLKNTQSATSSDESLLVKQSGAGLVYLSPTHGNFKLFHKLPDNNNVLASSYAYHNPGGFSEMRDYNGDDVLVTGRNISGSPWRLVQKVSVEEALSESTKHQQFLLTTFTLFILFIVSAFIATWRHSTSLRLREVSEALEKRTALLDAVTDNIKDTIILIDDETKIVFVNESFARKFEVQAEEIKTRQLASIAGVNMAKALGEIKSKDDEACLLPLNVNDEELVYHVSATSLLFGEHKNETLFVLHDISQLKQEQEKREQLANGILATLVKAVDLHDPFCANHSERTREVAVVIGKEMGLDQNRLQALEMAALLANIGKIFVAKEILTKMDALSEEESQQLKRNVEYTVEILSDLPFNGPVMEIIEQKNERMDGKGYPKGLTSSQIMLESRILSVANAFVATTSARAYREGCGVSEAIDILLEQAGTQYDRHVVAALFHIAENKSDWKTWQDIRQK